MVRRVKKNKRTYRIIGLVLILILVAACLVAFESHRRLSSEKIPAKSSPATSSSSTTTGTKSAKVTPPSAGYSAGSSSNNSESESTTPVQASILLSPSGNFVSNHHPGEDGTPTSEVSVCNTSPSASCYIQFTQGSSVKKLDAKTTDSNGTAIWYWDIQDAGFTAGSWQISAIASLNGQIKTSNDAAQLEVQN